MARIGKLNIEIGASNKTGKGLKAAGRDISRFAKSMGGMAFTGLTTGIASVAAGATAAGSAIGYLTMKSIDAVGDANDFAKSVGASYTELRKLQKAAQLSGVDLATTNVALMKMSDVLGSAFGGNAAAIESFEKIGVSVDALKRMRPEQQFVAIGEAINRIKDPSEKIAAARDIFGRSGGSLISFFANARQDIAEAGVALDRFGIALSQVDVEKIDAAGDAFGEWKFIVEGIGNQLAKQFSPLILDASDRLVKMIDDAGGVGNAVDKTFRHGVTVVGELLTTVEDLEIAWLNASKAVNDFFLNRVKVDPKSRQAKMNSDIETNQRLQDFPVHRREQARKMIEAQGGFENETVGVAAFKEQERLAAEHTKRMADIENRRSERGTLGDRFVAWERQAQLRSTADAAGKLANVSEERLDAEEKITKELKAQKGIAEGGQGKFALMAFNGAGSRPTGSKAKEQIAAAAVPEASAGAMAAAASSEVEAPFMPAVAYQPLSNAMAGPAASIAPAGSYAAWKEQHPNWGAKTPNYMSKIPDGPKGYESKTPGPRGYMDKMSPEMDAAFRGDPVAKNMDKDAAQWDKMLAVLEKIAGNTKSPTLGLA